MLLPCLFDPPAVAGSELSAQSNARVGGAVQKTGPFINKSLMFLGVIISRLSEGDKLAHLPFRDSKVSGAHDAAVALNGGVACACGLRA